MKLIQAKWVVYIALIAVLVAAAEAQDILRIDFEKYELPNGLDVILHEDHSIPVVAVSIWYHVGSKNEKPGRTGFAHLFEHMMFRGSQHHDASYSEPLEKVGGWDNGSTTQDRTNYYEVLPSNYLELALWLESDRMGFLLPAMTQTKLDTERDVVKNERRQGVDNRPYGKADEILISMLYPRDHPYSWPVIGRMEDLSVASLEDISDFFTNYYTPNNASLCIGGDFDPVVAKELVEKYFSPIPPGPSIDRLSAWLPELDGVRRAVTEDDVSLPRLYYSWHTPAWHAPGDAEFVLLAMILTSGKDSRLYRSLVHEQQIAQDVYAYQDSCELSSTFNIYATAREGHTLKELEEAIDAELAKVLSEGVTQEELAQARIGWEAQHMRAREMVLVRTQILNWINTYLGDPGKLQEDMERFTKATAENVNRFTNRYLRLDRRAILHVIPRSDMVAATTELDRSIQPAPMAVPSFTPPEIQRAKLSNGLELLLVRDYRTHTVQANVVIRGGWGNDPMDRPGAALLTAELLDGGTETRTAMQIAEDAKRLGADISTGSSYDESTVTLNVLKRNLDAGLELAADMVLNPTFPDDELERQRTLYLGRIQEQSKQASTVAMKLFLRFIHGPEHPYGQPHTGSGTEMSISAIGRDDLVNYYKANYLPNNAAIAMVGDITLDEAKDKLEKVFGNWEPGEHVQREIPGSPPPKATKVYIVDKPGAVQSAIVAGNLGIRRTDPDYMACEVLNQAFGGQFGSRISVNLREDKGYTYGARSSFFSYRGTGAFDVWTQVQTEVTAEAVSEIIRETRDIVGSRPLAGDELTDIKTNMIKGFPQGFETYWSIDNELSKIFIYDLPEDEWSSYISRVESIDEAAVAGAAREHLHPDAILIVIVGDREKIEPAIQKLALGNIHFVNAEGDSVE